MLGGSLVGQGTLIAISPILTRLYSPADFTMLAIVTAISSTLGGIATLAWEAAMVIPKGDMEARALAWLGLLSTLITSLGVALLFWVFQDILVRVFALDSLAHYWWIIPITVFSIGLYKVASSWFVRLQRFGQIAWRNGSQGIAQAGFNLGLGLAGIAPLGLIGGLAAGRGIALFGMVGASSAFSRPVPSAAFIRQVARRYRRFPLVTSWSNAANTLGLQLPILLLAAFYNAIEVGLVSLAIRVLASPVGILADALRQYYEGRFGELLREGAPNLKRIFLLTTSRLAMLGLLPTVVIMVFGPWIFSFVFGSAWVVAGEYARILVLAYYLQLVVSPVSASLTILEHQRQQLMWDVFRAIFTAGLVLAAWGSGAPIWIALLGICVAQVVSYAVLFALSFRAIHARRRTAS